MHFCTVPPLSNAKKHSFRLRGLSGPVKDAKKPPVLYDTGPEAPEKRLSGAGEEEGMPRIRRLSAWRSTVS